MTTAPDLAIAAVCVIVSIFGIALNGVVLIVITSSKELRRKDYICFILNRTLLDFVYCLLLGVLHPLAIVLTSPTSGLCIAAGALEVGIGSASIYIEPALACNRYISIFHSNIYKKVYKIGYVYVMCAFIWVLGFMGAAPHIVVGSLGRIAGSFCSINFSTDTLLVTILSNYTFVLAGLGLTIFFNFRIFRFLNRYQKQPMTNRQRTKLQNDKEMLKFIFVAAFLPLVFQSPAIVILWAQMMRPISAWYTFCGMSMFMVSFVVNPIVVLLMVRPLTIQFRRGLCKILGRYTAVVHSQEPVWMTSQYNAGGQSRIVRIE